jgi:hypothetical protein
MTSLQLMVGLVGSSPGRRRTSRPINPGSTDPATLSLCPTDTRKNPFPRRHRPKISSAKRPISICEFPHLLVHKFVVTPSLVWNIVVVVRTPVIASNVHQRGYQRIRPHRSVSLLHSPIPRTVVDVEVALAVGAPEDSSPCRPTDRLYAYPILFGFFGVLGLFCSAH